MQGWHSPIILLDQKNDNSVSDNRAVSSEWISNTVLGLFGKNSECIGNCLQRKKKTKSSTDDS